MLQNLLCLWKKKTHVIFFVFHLEQLWVLPYKCPGLCQHSVLAGLLYCILFPHELQLYFIFSWTDSLWALRFCEVAKLLWQESQLNLILSCIDFWWIFKFPALTKLFLHQLHSNLSPSWKVLKWFLRLCDLTKIL